MIKGTKAAVVLAATLPLAVQAWDYAERPLAYRSADKIRPNVVLMVDDSHSMHFQLVNESWRRVRAGHDAYAVDDWYFCTAYDNGAQQCSAVFASRLADLAGANTLDPLQTGVSILQETFTDTVPRYVYQGNGTTDEVPGVALCDVSKNPGDSGFYLGQAGDAAPGLSAAVSADHIGVLVSRSTAGDGSNDSCVRWKIASTGGAGGIDAYTAYPGDYLSFLLTKHAAAGPSSINFADSLAFPDTDSDPANFVPALDDKVIPALTRIEAARELAQKLVVDNYQDMRFGLYSLDMQQERACSVDTDPELDKAALVGPLYGTAPADLPASAADGLVGNLRAATAISPVARTHEAISDYFSGVDSPLRYRCQRSHIIVLTDGEANNDSGTLKGSAQAAYDNDAKTVGNDAGGRSWNEPDYPVQRVITHVVGLGLESDALQMAAPGETYFGNQLDAIAEQLGASIRLLTDVRIPAPSLAANGPAIDWNTLVFQGSLLTADWSGDVVAYPMGAYNQVNQDVPYWQASETLAMFGRGTLLTWNDAANVAVPFEWGNLSTAQQDALVSADAVEWLKGQDVAGYRTRSNGVLGDIANSNLLHVGTENEHYNVLSPAAGGDLYADYVAAKSGRTPMLFVGSNDGMLHGFDSRHGQELLGLVPAGVYRAWHDANDNNIPEPGETENKLYRLTQPDYEHRFFVDGQLTAGDAFIGGQWKTFLLGALGAGGRSVYAVDITDDTFTPADVKWEFTHPDLGRTFGKPLIARFGNNQWYAVFANGPDAAHDEASVFVVNLANPADYHELRTHTGSAASPNGAMAVQIRYNAQRTATAIYAGDLQGNVWVFGGLDDELGPSQWQTTGRKLFTARDPDGNAQAITGGLAVADHPYGIGTMVLFGTGKYFEKADSDYLGATLPRVESFYGVLDDGAANLARYMLVTQSFSGELDYGGRNFRHSTGHVVNYAIDKGWVIDLMNGTYRLGEKVFTAPVLDDTRVYFASQVPGQGDYCTGVASAYFNVLDWRDGSLFEVSVLDSNADGMADDADARVASATMDSAQLDASLILQHTYGRNLLSNESNALIGTLAIRSVPDADNDGIGDVLDPDDDNDGVPDSTDPFPLDPSEWLDSDGDGIGDNSDPTPNGDDDVDGVDNLADNCPSDANADQADFESDGQGDVCDIDDDNDGVYDWADPFPLDPSEWLDSDGDGIGDNSDPTPNGDVDGDGVDNLIDNCVYDWNADQLDTDGDWEGDACDVDDDNDGVEDVNDAFPFDPTEWSDFDGDGIGDNSDPDIDNDGVEDVVDPDPYDPAIPVVNGVLPLDGVYRGSQLHESVGLQ